MSRAGRDQPKPGRRTGRHPESTAVVVRLTDAAVEDLARLARKGDPQVVRWALKKCLLLERDPEAGEPLRGALIGFRKLIVGDRDWRIVWRVTQDDAGSAIVDVAEVWAVGARSESEVYEEVTQRARAMRQDPRSVPLAEALESLGALAAGLAAHPEPGVEAMPDWLVNVLIRVVGMPPDKVDELTPAQAQEVWDAYTRRPRGQQR